MIFMFFFFSFFFLSLKSFLFTSEFLGLSSNVSFMVCVSLITLLIIYEMGFCCLLMLENFVFFTFYFFLCFSLFFCFYVLSSFYFLIFVEILVYLVFFLIFLFSKDYDKISSLFFMMFFNISGSLPFMFFSFESFHSYVFYFNFFSSQYLFFSYLLFFFFSFLFLTKFPLFFFHFWLSKAHVSSSGCLSMILASLMLKIGTLGFFKFCIIFYSYLNNFFFSFCFFSYFILCLIMIRFVDLKVLIAYSSIIHMSFIFSFLVYLSNLTVHCSFMMMVGHGVVSCYLFFLITYLYEIFFNRSMEFNKNLYSSCSNFSFTFFFFMLLNLGFPPFINFFSELLSFSSASSFSNYIMFIFAVSLFISLIFTIFLNFKIMFGKKVEFPFGCTSPLFSLIFLSYFFVYCLFMVIFFF